jgi:hypothetical protein
MYICFLAPFIQQHAVRFTYVTVYYYSSFVSLFIHYFLLTYYTCLHSLLIEHLGYFWFVPSMKNVIMINVAYICWLQIRMTVMLKERVVSRKVVTFVLNLHDYICVFLCDDSLSFPFIVYEFWIVCDI